MLEKGQKPLTAPFRSLNLPQVGSKVSKTLKTAELVKFVTNRTIMKIGTKYKK